MRAIADLICGEVIVDVGSDHAYLPVWLWQNKKIKKAYALDISVNSINKIKKTIIKYNIPGEIIVPVLSNGFSGLFETHEIFEFSDVVIAGMGGENISRIIQNIKNINSNINFILQPNTKTEYLREFLYKNKFNIISESIAEDENRLYNIITAKFIDNINNTEDTYNPKLIDVVAGKNITNTQNQVYIKYIEKIIKKLSNILIDLDKKSEEKYNIQTEFGYYSEIEELISELKNL